VSTQTGPSWYPSKQFVHSPEPPAGARPEPVAVAASSRPSDHRGGVRRFLDRLLRRGPSSVDG
jgi:hypothetical protein